MAAGDKSITYTHTRGRYVKHTVIKVEFQSNGTTPVTSYFDEDEIPTAWYGGFVQGKVVGNTELNTVAVNIKSQNTGTLSNANQIIQYSEAVDGTTYLPMMGIVGSLAAGPPQANYNDGFVNSTRSLNIWTNTNNASETSQVIHLWISMLSYIMEV